MRDSKSLISYSGVTSSTVGGTATRSPIQRMSFAFHESFNEYTFDTFTFLLTYQKREIHSLSHTYTHTHTHRQKHTHTHTRLHIPAARRAMAPRRIFPDRVFGSFVTLNTNRKDATGLRITHPNRVRMKRNKIHMKNIPNEAQPSSYPISLRTISTHSFSK